MKPMSHQQMFPKTSRAIRSALALVSGETVTITIARSDIKSLKKLAVVSHHIAAKMGNERVQKEQEGLATVLDQTIRKIESAMGKGRG